MESKIRQITHQHLLCKLDGKKRADGEKSPATINELNAVIRTMSGRGAFDVHFANGMEAADHGWISAVCDVKSGKKAIDEEIPFIRANGRPLEIPPCSLVQYAFYRADYSPNISDIVGSLHIKTYSGGELLTPLRKEDKYKIFITENDLQTHQDTGQETAQILFKPGRYCEEALRIKLFLRYLKY